MTDKPEKKTVEAMILQPVRIAAQRQAAKQDRQLAAVARAILVKISETAQPSPDGVAHPARRPSTVPRKRLKFRMDKAQHEIVMDRIRASGSSLTAALEKGLEDYARTGKF